MTHSLPDFVCHVASLLTWWIVRIEYALCAHVARSSMKTRLSPSRTSPPLWRVRYVPRSGSPRGSRGPATMIFQHRPGTRVIQLAAYSFHRFTASGCELVAHASEHMPFARLSVHPARPHLSGCCACGQVRSLFLVKQGRFTHSRDR